MENTMFWTAERKNTGILIAFAFMSMTVFFVIGGNAMGKLPLVTLIILAIEVSFCITVTGTVIVTAFGYIGSRFYGKSNESEKEPEN